MNYTLAKDFCVFFIHSIKFFMNTLYLQFWELSERGNGVTPYGASLHLDIDKCKMYKLNILKERSLDDIPDSYEKTVGEPIPVKVSDNLYHVVLDSLDVKIEQHQLNNLLKLNDIILK